MKATAVILFIFVLGLLSACATEKGGDRHIKKGQEAGSMLNENRESWEAVVFKQPGAAEPVGMHATRDQCGEQAMQHIKEKAYQNASYSCSLQ